MPAVCTGSPSWQQRAAASSRWASRTSMRAAPYDGRHVDSFLDDYMRLYAIFPVATTAAVQGKVKTLVDVLEGVVADDGIQPRVVAKVFLPTSCTAPCWITIILSFSLSRNARFDGAADKGIIFGGCISKAAAAAPQIIIIIVETESDDTL